MSADSGGRGQNRASVKSQSSGNQQVAMVKVVYVSIPKEFRKPDGVLTRDLADKLNVTGEE